MNLPPSTSLCSSTTPSGSLAWLMSGTHMRDLTGKFRSETLPSNWASEATSVERMACFSSMARITTVRLT